jgi:ABC-type uncharacterized transport system auxiliary subunit
MKKLILALIMLFFLFGCASKKKTQETKEKAIEKTEVAQAESKKSETETKTAETKKENEVKTETETVIKYSPKKNEATGKYEPFKMQSGTGAGKSSIEIDGNGDVLIRSIQTQLAKDMEDTKIEIAKMKDDYTLQIKAQNEKILEYETKIVEKERSVFKLWLAIIVLAVLLAISIYFHIIRTKVPFLNK